MILNAAGMVLDIARSYQLEPGESGDLCGPWSVSSLKFAGLPGKGARGSAEDIDQWADTMADKWLAGGHVSAGGSSIQDMHDFLSSAVEDFGPTPGQHRLLHWWDLDVTNVENIRKAVRAGYPVLFTANEANIISKKTGQRAYPWSLDVNHILPVAGIDRAGDFICADELNNKFQGEWPCVYLASRLHPSWAAIVQVVGPDPNKPWLAPIPSGNPNTWPANFNAQLFAPPVLPNGATDDGSAIHFPNGLMIVKGFRQKYLELVAVGKVPADDIPLVNEYPCHPVEKSDPAWWGTSQTNKGSAQETRYFRFGYSPLKGVRVTYVGQELHWYQQQITSGAH